MPHELLMCSCFYSFGYNSLVCCCCCLFVCLFFDSAESVFRVTFLSFNNSPCHCAIHVPSLSVPQPFMSLGRHRWRSSRESPTLYVLGSSRRDRIVYSFHIHVRWQPSPSCGVHFQTAAFKCTKKYGEEEAIMTDYQWAVFCRLTSQIPRRHPPPLSLPPCSSISRIISPSVTGTQFTDVGTRFYH